MKNLLFLISIFILKLNADEDCPRIIAKNNTNVVINIYFTYQNEDNASYAIQVSPNGRQNCKLRSFVNDEYFDQAQIQIKYDPFATRTYAIRNNLNQLFEDVQHDRINVEKSDLAQVQREKSYIITIENGKFKITEENQIPEVV
jgi:hypothetical protein